MTVEKVQIELAKTGGVNTSGLKRNAVYNGKDKTGTLITTTDALAANPDDSSVKINKHNQLYIPGGGPRRTIPIQVTDYRSPTAGDSDGYTRWASNVGPITHIYGADWAAWLMGAQNPYATSSGGLLEVGIKRSDYSGYPEAWTPIDPGNPWLTLDGNNYYVSFVAQWHDATRGWGSPRIYNFSASFSANEWGNPQWDRFYPLHSHNDTFGGAIFSQEAPSNIDAWRWGHSWPPVVGRDGPSGSSRPLALKADISTVYIYPNSLDIHGYTSTPPPVSDPDPPLLGTWVGNADGTITDVTATAGNFGFVYDYTLADFLSHPASDMIDDHTVYSDAAQLDSDLKIGAITIAIFPAGDSGHQFNLAHGALVGDPTLPFWPVTGTPSFMSHPFDVSSFLDGYDGMADFYTISDIGPYRFSASIYWG